MISLFTNPFISASILAYISISLVICHVFTENHCSARERVPTSDKLPWKKSNLKKRCSYERNNRDSIPTAQKGRSRLKKRRRLYLERYIAAPGAKYAPPRLFYPRCFFFHDRSGRPFFSILGSCTYEEYRLPIPASVSLCVTL